MKSLQLEKPHAIVMVGIQGSGKSFFARKFSDTFNAPYIEQNVLATHAIDTNATDALVSLMLEQVLKTRHSVVIEVDTAAKASRLQLMKRLKDAGYTPLFVWVQVDVETAKLRSMKQAGITSELYDAELKRFTPPSAVERPLVISGKHTYATQARIILKKLSAPRATAPQRPGPSRGQIIVR